MRQRLTAAEYRQTLAPAAATAPAGTSVPPAAVRATTNEFLFWSCSPSISAKVSTAVAYDFNAARAAIVNHIGY
jgi:hypothetical protein